MTKRLVIEEYGYPFFVDTTRMGRVMQDTTVICNFKAGEGDSFNDFLERTKKLLQNSETRYLYLDIETDPIVYDDGRMEFLNWKNLQIKWQE